MAPHSSTLAWKIPWTEAPGRLQSMGSLRVGHDWMTSLSLFPFMHWRRTWQPTPVFLPGESQGRGSLVGRRLWGHTESDTTDATEQQQQGENVQWGMWDLSAQWWGIKPVSPAVEAQNFNHWTAREVTAIMFNNLPLRKIWENNSTKKLFYRAFSPQVN